MLTMFGWSSRAASRASFRNISTNCRSRARCGRIRFRQTSFSKPAAPAWRARYTSAIPPEAIRRRSLYLPSGGVIPGEIRPQGVQLRDLSAGESRERARAVHQRRGRAAVPLLSGVPRPIAEQVEQPAIEGVLIVELGIGRRFLPGRKRNGTVRLVRRRQRRRAGREETTSLDHQQASLGGDPEPVLVALRREPSDGGEQRQDQEPEHEALERSAPPR